MVATTETNSATATPTSTADRFMISGISWDTYERILTDLEAAGRKYRLTYDSGDLEIEMPTYLHEILISITRQLLEQYLLHAGIEFTSSRSTTWKRRLQQKGVEADESYYIQNVERVSSASQIDLNISPPPDLAIETEVTTPVLSKLPIYASLGVNEIWKIKEDLSVQFLLLIDNEYKTADRSIAAPIFTPELLRRFLQIRMGSRDSSTIQQFRNEVLAHLKI